MFRLRNSYNSDVSARFISLDSTNYLRQPELDNSSTSFDADLSLLIKRKQISLVYRLGYNKWRTANVTYLSNNITYSNSSHKNGFQNINFGSGVYYPIPNFRDRFKMKIFSIVGLEYSFPSQRTSLFERFNEIDELKFNSMETVSFPEEYSLIGNFGLGGYYYFFDRIALGIELNHRFFYRWAKGNVRVSQFSQQDGEESNINEYFIDQNKNSMGNLGSIFFILTYKIKE